MKNVIIQLSLIVFAVAAVISIFALYQTNLERNRFQNQVEHETDFLLSSLKIPLSALINSSPKELEVFLSGLDKKVISNSKVVVYKKSGQTLASTSGDLIDERKFVATAKQVVQNDITLRATTAIDGKKYYYIFSPLENSGVVSGVLAIFRDTSGFDEIILGLWRSAIFAGAVWIVVFSFLSLIYGRILTDIIVDLLKIVRSGRFDPSSTNISLKLLFPFLVSEVSQVSKSLNDARKTASEEARLRLEKLETPWTSQRLQEFAKVIMKGRGIYMVSNREPYIHVKKGNAITYFEPASGMVTAIEPMMKATGGVWIATGSGNADRLVVDAEGKIRVPPDEPSYTLKRMWLTPEEEKGFYLGFSNEGLWPLCHMAHTRPVFRKEDWDQYTRVNGEFAAAVLKEIRHVHKPIVFIQDYLFALLPRMIKKSRPDALIGIFWHIPWPNSEAFRICPWRRELLQGMLGADLLGFHTQLHGNNFIDTVGRELEALINRDRFVVTHENHESHVKSFPISIPFVNGEYEKHNEVAEKVDIRKKLDIKVPFIGLGVDRLDYTKGILERLRGVEKFLDRNPSFKEQFVFIQLGEPSRSAIPEYREFEERVEKEVGRINDRLKTRHWKPIIFIKRHHSHSEIYDYYRVANVCLVTSLHDGMNLVAKEYISARGDEQGVLILSQFTGASQDLRDALIVNPYDTSEVAESIRIALQMLPSDQKKRMVRMRNVVRSYNIYRWSAEYLKTLVEIE